MPRTPRDVTDAELAILEVLWGQGSATRRQITDALYPGGGPSHYTTVQKLLERLEEKGHVGVDRRAKVLAFTAALGREELIGRRLQEMAERLCGGDRTPLLLNLVRAKPLTPRELAQLRALVEEWSREASAKGSSRKK